MCVVVSPTNLLLGFFFLHLLIPSESTVHRTHQDNNLGVIPFHPALLVQARDIKRSTRVGQPLVMFLQNLMKTSEIQVYKFFQMQELLSSGINLVRECVVVNKNKKN